MTRQDVVNMPEDWNFHATCRKGSDQTGPNAGGLCNNVYDLLGCEYNAPSAVDANTFEYVRPYPCCFSSPGYSFVNLFINATASASATT